MPDQTEARDGDAPRVREPMKRLHWCALALILAFAALFRVGVADRMAPQRPEPDAYLLLQYEVFAGRLARDDAPPHFGFYPTFLARSLALGLGDAPYELAPANASTREHLAAAARPLVSLRVWLAALCVLGVAGVFALVRELWGPRAGLIASALVACSLLHIVYSHQARPHAAHMTFQVWALYFAVRQIERPGAARILMTSLAAFACMASLQTGVFLAPTLALAALAKSSWRVRALALAAPIAAFAFSQMFHVGGISISSEGISMASDGHAVELSELRGGGVAPTWQVLRDYEPVLLGLALAGALLVLAARGRTGYPGARGKLAAVALCAYALPYLAFALLNEATRDRYLIPLLPFLAALAAFAVDAAARSGAGPGARPGVRGRRALAVAAPLLALTVPLHDAARYYALARRPDTLEQAAAWFEQQPDATSTRITMSSYVVLPLRYSPQALKHSSRFFLAAVSPWISYQLRLGDAASADATFDLRPFTAARTGRDSDRADIEARLAQLAPTYVVLEPSRRQRSVPWHAILEEVVRANATRVALFEPDGVDPPRDELFEYGDVTGLRTRLAGANSMGPPLEIYRWNGR
jgi:hypothetical protein